MIYFINFPSVYLHVFLLSNKLFPSYNLMLLRKFRFDIFCHSLKACYKTWTSKRPPGNIAISNQSTNKVPVLLCLLCDRHVLNYSICVLSREDGTSEEFHEHSTIRQMLDNYSFMKYSQTMKWISCKLVPDDSSDSLLNKRIALTLFYRVEKIVPMNNVQQFNRKLRY